MIKNDINVDTSNLPVPNGALIRKTDDIFYFIHWNEAGLWDLYEIGSEDVVSGQTDEITYRTLFFMEYVDTRITSILKVDMVTEYGDTSARLCDEHPMTMAAIVRDMMNKWFHVNMPVSPNITQNYIDTGSTTKH